MSQLIANAVTSAQKNYHYPLSGEKLEALTSEHLISTSNFSMNKMGGWVCFLFRLVRTGKIFHFNMLVMSGKK